MADITLGAFVADHGMADTAKIMGITRQRVHQMISRGVPVFIRVKRGVVIGWYTYRSVALQA